MNTRQEDILEATVKDYIETASPVSSKKLKEAYSFSCSSATIRKEFKALVDQGYLQHPHTSSGRVPTTKAYRFYVDQLKAKNADLPKLVTLIKDISMIGRSIQESLQQISELVSAMTPYTTVLFLPDLVTNSIKATYLLSMDLNRILVVLLGQAGLKQEFLCELEDDFSQDELNKLSQVISEKIEGRSVQGITEDFIKRVSEELPNYRKALSHILSSVKQYVETTPSQTKVQTFGKSKLLQFPDFNSVESLKDVMSILDETILLGDLFQRYCQKETNYKVIIGEEGGKDFAQDCSMVMSSSTLAGDQIAGIGFIGPNRMPYSEMIPFVQGVCDEIKLLSTGQV